MYISRVIQDYSFLRRDKDAIINRVFCGCVLLLFNVLCAIQNGADDRDLAVCVLYGSFVETPGFLMIRVLDGLLPKIGVEALFVIAEQELLPPTVERLTELH